MWRARTRRFQLNANNCGILSPAVVVSTSFNWDEIRGCFSKQGTRRYNLHTSWNRFSLGHIYQHDWTKTKMTVTPDTTGSWMRQAAVFTLVLWYAQLIWRESQYKQVLISESGELGMMHTLSMGQQVEEGQLCVICISTKWSILGEQKWSENWALRHAILLENDETKLWT